MGKWEAGKWSVRETKGKGTRAEIKKRRGSRKKEYHDKRDKGKE